jgi:YD repeat-containing protein
MKNILVLFLIVSVPRVALSQTAERLGVSFPTPNAASLGLYSDVPVSNFTGTPNVHIPIYEVNEGPIKIPIALSYHAASVRVHSHPGWVGLGWTLLAGGAITRTVNGQADEHTSKVHGGEPTGFYATRWKLDNYVHGWETTAGLTSYANDYYVAAPNPVLEAMPDEFTFNFQGYSGRFFMSHTGEWTVISDQRIKVEFDPTMGEGFIAESNLRSEISSRITAYGSTANKELWTGRHFNKFTLIAPDGMRYEFGGVNATEYVVPYRAQGRYGPQAVTWFLTKIIAPTGQVVNFAYEPGKLITSLTNHFSATTWDRHTSYPFYVSEIACEGSTPLMTDYDGPLMFPVYLTSITHSLGVVHFDRTASTELRWPPDNEIDNDMDFPPFQAGPVVPVFFIPPGTGLSGFGMQREWVKLTSIRVDDDTDYSYMTVKQFDFTYTESAETRLKLLAIQEKTPYAGITKPPYVFKYNPRPLPSYSDIKANDHWDYYNGLNPSDFAIGSYANGFSGFYKSREPDTYGDFMTAEVLEQIQYPTGGAVRFEFEPHEYSKAVNREVTTFPLLTYSHNRKCGGLRIKRISHYNNITDLKPATIKEYFYVKDFSLQSDISQLTSSGILWGHPKYYWPNYQARDMGGNVTTYSVFSSGSQLPFGYNNAGTHIGYSEVVEVSRSNTGASNGFIKYKYTNFDIDIWGDQYPDEVGTSNDPARSIYSPYTSNDFKRGKLVSEDYYNEVSSSPMKTIKYKYTMSSANYVRRVLQEPFDICTQTNLTGFICFVTAFKTYEGSFNLTQRQEIEYDGLNPSTTITNFSYDNDNLLVNTSISTSDDVLTETTVRYPKSFAIGETVTSTDWAAIGISKLRAKQIINVPVEIVKKRNGLVIGASYTGFKWFGDKVLPHKTWVLETTAGLPVGQTISNSTGQEITHYNPSGTILEDGSETLARDEHYTDTPIVYNQYDSKGNLLEVFNAEDLPTSYIWSYNRSKPALEIIGANYSQVQTAANAIGINLESFGQVIQTDSYYREKINALRSVLPTARLSGYTYGFFGVTSKVDFNGRITFYEYDTLGRLVQVKDHDGNILISYNYHYSGQN